MQALELKIPPLALVLLFAVLMALITWLTPELELSHRLRIGNAACLTGLGFGFALAGVASFRRAQTTVNPLAPESSSSLVKSGVYRYSRNPMYVGFLLWLLAWGIYLSNGWALLVALAFIPYMNRFQIVPEEKALQNLFGEEYSHYCKQVRRWL